MQIKELSLDDILARKRASDKATAIMGKKRVRAVSKSRGITTASGNGMSGGAGRLTTTTNGRWPHDLHHKNNPRASRVSKIPSTISPAVARALQNNRLFAALHAHQVQIHSPRGRGGGAARGSGTRGGVTAATVGTQIRGSAPKKDEFHIRGSAGPGVLQADGFASGTTAEDIKHAMKSIGKILSCIILTAVPTVISEIVFEDRESAEKCVKQYNGQRADGRLLRVFFKKTAPIAPLSMRRGSSLESPQALIDHYAEREEADRRRREMNIVFQDGRYGVPPPPMYSDALLQKGRGFIH